jgi:hypothetical protein
MPTRSMRTTARPLASRWPRYLSRLAPPEVPEADLRPRVWTARPWRPRDPGLSGRPKLRGKPNLRPTRNSLTGCPSSKAYAGRQSLSFTCQMALTGGVRLDLVENVVKNRTPRRTFHLFGPSRSAAEWRRTSPAAAGCCAVFEITVSVRGILARVEFDRGSRSHASHLGVRGVPPILANH